MIEDPLRRNFALVICLALCRLIQRPDFHFQPSNRLISSRWIVPWLFFTAVRACASSRGCHMEYGDYLPRITFVLLLP